MPNCWRTSRARARSSASKASESSQAREIGEHGSARANAELQVLHHREAVDELKVLEGACKPHAGSGMRRQVGYVLAGQSDATGIGAVKAADTVDERGFARTIRTDQRVHGAALDWQGKRRSPPPRRRRTWTGSRPRAWDQQTLALHQG